MKRITVTITDNQFDLLELWRLKYGASVSRSVREELRSISNPDDAKELAKLRKKEAGK